MIQFINVSKAYKQHNVLENINLSINEGELVVLTLYSSTSYFIYRGQDMGFQYELSEQFAKSLGVKLRQMAPAVPRMC